MKQLIAWLQAHEGELLKKVILILLGTLLGYLIKLIPQLPLPAGIDVPTVILLLNMLDHWLLSKADATGKDLPPPVTPSTP